MSADTAPLPGRAFLAFPEMSQLLRDELKARFGIDTPPPPKDETVNPQFTEGETQWQGRLLYCPDFPAERQSPYWAQTALNEPQLLRFDSMGDAAKAMRGIQRNWASYQCQCWRRAQIIQEKLPFIQTKPKKFPAELSTTPMGIFTLTDANRAIISAATSSFLPCGKLEFTEDHTNPPSRAYLKLQESLTLVHHLFGIPYPTAGDRCLDAGACPGGWTWVLRGFGAAVHAIDRSPLAEKLMRDPLVTFQAHDAFTIPPAELGAFNWVVSDVICYPDRLLPWVKGWIDSGLAKNIICTIKLQGGIDWKTIAEFAALPNSRVVHLNYNKHELTYLYAEMPVIS